MADNNIVLSLEFDGSLSQTIDPSTSADHVYVLVGVIAMNTTFFFVHLNFCAIILYTLKLNFLKI